METISKVKIGIIFGIVAGIIDVVPMLFQRLTWDANLSAFTFWVIAGFFIATTNIKVKGVLKGISISILLLIPLAFIIGWHEPLTLIPITIMNLILGGLLGYSIDRFGEK